MKIPEKGKEIVIQKLSSLRLQCTCGTNAWIINDTIFEMREFQEGNIVLGGQQSLLPLISVHCKNCSHTFFFNALTMGAIVNKNEK